MAGANFILCMIRKVGAFFRPSYRPERHYMRGPGPACARKSGGTLTL